MFKAQALLILAVLCSFCYAQPTIKITSDLRIDSSGFLAVTVNDLNFTEKEIEYILPKVIPGSYEAENYGQFIHDFTINYKDGNHVSVKNKMKNTFRIPNAQLAESIRYNVKHTHIPNEVYTTNKIFDAGGTQFLKDDYFLLNFHAIIGYFTGYQNATYEVTLLKPDNFIGSSALNITQRSSNLDFFKTGSYDQLVDSPILYDDFDNSHLVKFSVENMSVEIAVISDNDLIDADMLAKPIKKIVANISTASFLKGKLPDKYAFLFLFGKKYNAQSGALEHNRSSVYALSSDTSGLKTMLPEFISHEFLHIYSPLNIRSELIHPFNFSNPKEMSSHLWLYEGITEYLSFKNNLDIGFIDAAQFYNAMRLKNNNGNLYKKSSLTKMSKHVLSKKGQRFYTNYYEKGAVIGFYLDYLITKNSDGKKGIHSLLNYLIQNYNTNKPFIDDALITEITTNFPSTSTCFEHQIKGKEYIPIEQIFDNLGVRFEKDKDSVAYSYWSNGFSRLSYNIKSKTFEARNSILLKQYGKKKVEISAVNGIESKNLSFMDLFVGNDDGKPIRLTLIENGEETECILQPEKVAGYYHPLNTLLDTTSDEKIYLRNQLQRFN